MVKWLFLLIIVAAAMMSLSWYRKKEGRHTNKRRNAKKITTGDSKKYHCVAVKYRSSACKLVEELKDKRFLSAEAPDLPLPGCTAKDCHCRFVHYEDRRQDDRRDPFSHLDNPVQSPAAPDRRSRTDRRKSNTQIEL